MALSIAIVGLPNVGKSTLFNALTKKGAEASNYPFCTIDPNVGIVTLQDERLDKVSEIVGSAKTTHTTLEFIDIAGLVKGASQGEGLGNQFLNHIQGVDAVAHVVRCFEDKNVAHTSSELNPVDDVEVVLTELILKDLEIVERSLSKLQQAVKSGDPKLKDQLGNLNEIKQQLEMGIPLKKMELATAVKGLIRDMNLLTIKPAIYIANIDECDVENNKYVDSLQKYAEGRGEPCTKICGKVQEEISQLDKESQIEFLSEWGLDELSLNKIVRAGYSVLNLITFFTANENEAHAWTIPEGTVVQKAAAKVHTDFEAGFIKAEVIKFKDLIEIGSLKEIKQKGLMAIHGKEYIVEDGDLIFFRTHN